MTKCGYNKSGEMYGCMAKVLRYKRRYIGRFPYYITPTYFEMRRAVWGLPQAEIIANKRLRRKLAPFGYYKCVNMPGLWPHKTRAISFILVVDNVGVKYVKKEDVDHLQA